MSSAVSITDASSVCCHGSILSANGSRACSKSPTSVTYAENLLEPVPGASDGSAAPRGGTSISDGCGRTNGNRSHGYLRTPARTAAVRSRPIPDGPRTSVVVRIRNVCAFPSNPSDRPSRCRAIRSSTCSPRCPNGGWPRSWASAAASATSGSHPPSFSHSWAYSGDDVSRSAIVRATCATFRLCVNRLCNSPESPALTTWVTPPSRAKNGDAAMRSRSTRNSVATSAPAELRLPAARPSPASRRRVLSMRMEFTVIVHDGKATTSSSVATTGRPSGHHPAGDRLTRGIECGISGPPAEPRRPVRPRRSGLPSARLGRGRRVLLRRAQRRNRAVQHRTDGTQQLDLLRGHHAVVADDQYQALHQRSLLVAFQAVQGSPRAIEGEQALLRRLERDLLTGQHLVQARAERGLALMRIVVPDPRQHGQQDGHRRSHVGQRPTLLAPRRPVVHDLVQLDVQQRRQAVLEHVDP